jgi:4-amino-4-deoxy-L-arabinose transferase-like glycosyltransferase
MKKSARILAVLIFVGFILRIVAAEVFRGGLNSGYQGDEAGYMALATRVVQGLGFTDNHGIPVSYPLPGLPLLLAMPISILGPNVALIRMFTAVIGSLLVPACYLLCRSSTGSQKLGWIAAAIAVFFPTWVIYSSLIFTDIPVTVLVTLMVWMLIEGYRRQSLLWIVGAGTAWGIAISIRAVCLVYAPGIVLWLLLIMPGWKRRLAAVMVMIVPSACILAPWSLRNTYIYGRFILISALEGSELYRANNPEATGIDAIDDLRFHEILSQRYPADRYPDKVVRSKLLQAEAVEFIRENPWRFAQLSFIRFIQFWKLYSPRVPLSHSLLTIASFGVALPFFLIQVIRLGWRRGPEMLFLLIILCQAGFHTIYSSNVRYRMPIEPLIIVMAITGLYWTWGRFRAVATRNVKRSRRLPDSQVSSSLSKQPGAILATLPV